MTESLAQVLQTLNVRLARANRVRDRYRDDSADPRYFRGQIDAFQAAIAIVAEAGGFEPPVVTATGKVLTEKDIQALADEAERGYDVSLLKNGFPERPGADATALERIDYHLSDHGGRLLRTQSRLNQIEADLQGINEKLDRLLAIQDPATAT